jgi:hypothetical protein
MHGLIVLHEGGEQLEFGGGELKRLAVEEELQVLAVEREGAAAQLGDEDDLFRAPQDGADAQEELAGGKWLREVVVRADLEAGDLVSGCWRCGCRRGGA